MTPPPRREVQPPLFDDLPTEITFITPSSAVTVKYMPYCTCHIDHTWTRLDRHAADCRVFEPPPRREDITTPPPCK
jgi:hypothetical protein